VHAEFRRQHEEILQSNPQLRKPLYTQYRKALADPVRAGKAMHSIPGEELRGKLHRLWIGGKKGYRLVYYFSTELDIILPAWISPVPRTHLDYEKADWLDCADQYCSDLLEGNMDQFEDWTKLLLQIQNVHKTTKSLPSPI